MERDPSPAVTRAGIDAILFWGGMGAIVGLLGTLIGIVIMAEAVALAGGAHPTLIWSGIKISLPPLIVGLMILGLSLAVWYAFRGGFKRCRRSSASAAVYPGSR